MFIEHRERRIFINVGVLLLAVLIAFFPDSVQSRRDVLSCRHTAMPKNGEMRDVENDHLSLDDHRLTFSLANGTSMKPAASNKKFSQEDLDEIFLKRMKWGGADQPYWVPQREDPLDPDGLWLVSAVQNCRGRWVYFAPDGRVFAYKNHTRPSDEECQALDPRKLPPESTETFAFKFDKFDSWYEDPNQMYQLDYPCKDLWKVEYNKDGISEGLSHYLNFAFYGMLLPTKKLVQQGASYTCLRNSHISQGRCNSKEGEKLTLDTVLIKGSEDNAEWFAQSISKRFRYVYVDCAQDYIWPKLTEMLATQKKIEMEVDPNPQVDSQRKKDDFQEGSEEARISSRHMRRILMFDSMLFGLAAVCCCGGIFVWYDLWGFIRESLFPNREVDSPPVSPQGEDEVTSHAKKETSENL